MKPVGKPLHTPHDIYVLAQNCLFCFAHLHAELDMGQETTSPQPAIECLFEGDIVSHNWDCIFTAIGIVLNNEYS